MLIEYGDLVLALGDCCLTVSVTVCVITLIKLGLVLQSCTGTIFDLCPGAVWNLVIFVKRLRICFLVPVDALCIHR